MPMIKTLRQFLVMLPVALVATGIAQAQENNTKLEVKPYIANYKLFRSGEEYGTAKRELFALDSLFRLRYESSINWMIFSDERYETSEFIIDGNQVKPLKYEMERKGTGPDRSYEVVFDRENKKIVGPSKRRKRKKGQEESPTSNWNENWLDPISYQQQLYIDLKLGKTEFTYQFVNRKGQEHEYIFKVTGTEPLVLPYGKVEAIKVERIYEGDSERQTIAWFAPALDYALVRIWKGKSGVEQFDIQLSELVE